MFCSFNCLAVVAAGCYFLQSCLRRRLANPSNVSAESLRFMRGNDLFGVYVVSGRLPWQKR